ncbi:MAG: rhomboid family intramembrane serine protease [Elusimicrobia bacterium]|nr:MAG: rhomboid family intramembrane serine protease [Elusimicrobiota bacterium]
MMSPTIKGLILVNVIVFGLSMVVGGQFITLFGLIPAKVIHERLIWQPITYMFLHANLFHILFNLFALWMFGMPVESQWGPRQFLKYYMICGVGAGIVNVFLTPDSLSPIIGASGAIYGLLVAFAMLYPDAVVYLYFFFPIKAKHMAILFGLVEFFAGTSSSSPTVARFAHLAGMVIGYVYIKWWWTIKLKTVGFIKSMVSRPSDNDDSSFPRVAEPVPAAKKVSDEAVEVDRILDKILEKGEESLTDKERDVLRRQAKRPPEGHA